MSRNAEKKPGLFARTLKLFLAIFAILLVAPVMQQLDVSEQTVRIAGRVAVGVALALILFGIIAKMFKVLAYILIALVVLAILASEGVIKVPNLIEKAQQKREQVQPVQPR